MGSEEEWKGSQLSAGGRGDGQDDRKGGGKEEVEGWVGVVCMGVGRLSLLLLEAHCCSG